MNCLKYKNPSRFPLKETNAPAKLGMAEADEKQPPKFRHISDIDVWLTPDRNYFMFILASVFGGLFAMDHFYLRSFDTGFKKILLNIFGLGIWYFWDLLQIFTDGRRIQTEGLSSPFDWIKGIGRGVFGDPAVVPKFVPEKSYIIWAFLAIYGGFFALDKFYLGDYMHAFTKLISIFSPLILFGLLWVIWDAYQAFFNTKGVVSGKISLPIPLTWFGYNETDGRIFLPSAPKPAGGISAIAQAIAGFTSMPAGKKSNFMAALLGPLASTKLPPVIGKVQEAVSTATSAASAAKSMASGIATAASNVTTGEAAAAEEEAGEAAAGSSA